MLYESKEDQESESWFGFPQEETMSQTQFNSQIISFNMNQDCSDYVSLSNTQQEHKRFKVNDLTYLGHVDTIAFINEFIKLVPKIADL